MRVYVVVAARGFDEMRQDIAIEARYLSLRQGIVALCLDLGHRVFEITQRETHFGAMDSIRSRFDRPMTPAAVQQAIRR